MPSPFPTFEAKSKLALTRSQDSLSPEIRQGMRVKLVHAMDKALDVIIKALDGKNVKATQLYAAKMMIPYAPRMEHGAAPVTLVFPGIPRPSERMEPEERHVVIEADPAGGGTLPQGEPTKIEPAAE